MYVKIYYIYPDTESNSKEVIWTHLWPGPGSKLLSVVHSQHRSVRSTVKLLSGTLQRHLLLAKPAGGHSQQDHGAKQTQHVVSGEL